MVTHSYDQFRTHGRNSSPSSDWAVGVPLPVCACGGARMREGMMARLLCFLAPSSQCLPMWLMALCNETSHALTKQGGLISLIRYYFPSHCHCVRHSLLVVPPLTYFLFQFQIPYCYHCQPCLTVSLSVNVDSFLPTRVLEI